MDWIAQFEELSALDEKEHQFLASRARCVTLAADQCVFAPDNKPEAFLLLLEGTVVVRQFGASGREIVLYRVVGGQSCIMTTACLLSDEEYRAEGVTETAVKAVALGRTDFDELMTRSPAFRRFVFSKYASRVTRLMEVLEDVAFERIDRRLARKLLEFAGNGVVVDATHHSLAVELGTAREVISRQLKEFGRKGLIVTARGHIEIVDCQALMALAEQA